MNLDQTVLLLVCAAISLIGGVIAGIITASIIAKKKSYKRISKVLKEAAKVSDFKELTQIITQELEENQKEHEDLDKSIGIINWERTKNIKKIDYVRYDSTEDISGRLSFSLVLLNEENSGIILTNIHMIEGSSLYLREVVKGNCEINLSEEEISVLKSTCSK